MAVSKIGIDLGTCSVKYCLYGSGKIYTEPAIAAADAFTGKVLAYGAAAEAAQGRANDSVKILRVMRDGVIVNYALARYIIGDIVDRICKSRILKPDIIASVSGGVTGLERKTMLDVLYDAGAGKAYLMEEPVAAAFGAGMGNDKPGGCAVLDVGGGSVDCAVVTMNSIAVSRSIPEAGNAMTREIMRYLQEERGVQIGFAAAEQAKHLLANAVMRSEEIAMVLGGKRVSGEGINFELTSSEMRFVLKDFFEAIRELVVSVFDETAPDLLGDIAAGGLILTGGSAEIYGLSDYLSRTLRIPVFVPENPRFCVMNGIRKALPLCATLAEKGFLYTQTP